MTVMFHTLTWCLGNCAAVTFRSHRRCLPNNSCERSTSFEDDALKMVTMPRWRPRGGEYERGAAAALRRLSPPRVATPPRDLLVRMLGTHFGKPMVRIKESVVSGLPKPRVFPLRFPIAFARPVFGVRDEAA